MIGIIGAMEVEVENLFNQMTSKEKITLNGYDFFKGNLYNKDIVVVKCGIGKVNAALCTQTLISNFNVEKIINTGIAGATEPGLNIYDFVVSTQALYHDVDITFFGYKEGQLPGLPEAFPADSILADLAVKTFNNSPISKNGKIIKGLIASGDQFIADREQKYSIVNRFHPSCVEMEGAAIAHACYINKVPFVILRCMSDCADESSQEVYDESKAAKLSSTFLIQLIKEI